jgi:hypothetical protein
MQRLTATIEQVVNRLNYTLKIINNDTIKIMTNKLEYNKTIIDRLKEKKLNSTNTKYQIFKDKITTSKETEAGLPRGSVLRPVLCLIYKRDLPTSDNTTLTFADDTAILVTHEDPAIAIMKLQATINKIDDWEKKWRIKINQRKSTHITFTLRNPTCPTVQTDNVDLPEKNEVNTWACISIED